MSAIPFSAFKYSSPLEFIQDAYDYLHGIDESFSYERISNLCNFKSRTEVRNVFKGQRNPTSAEIEKIGQVFGLTEAETAYLNLLFKFHNSSDNTVTADLFEKLISTRNQSVQTSSPFREIEIATSVLHMTLLSALELGLVQESFLKSPDRMVSLLKNKFSFDEISRAVNELLEYQFLQIDPATGHLQPTQKHIKKYDFNSNFFLKRYHQQCLEMAQKSLENESPTERYLVGASFCINSKVFPRIIQKMNAFVENLMQLEGVAGSPDTVIQINQQLIRMTVGHAKQESGLGHQPTERALEKQQ
jgi:uncharacterized protein (TIGR02147 family)